MIAKRRAGWHYARFSQNAPAPFREASLVRVRERPATVGLPRTARPPAPATGLQGAVWRCPQGIASLQLRGGVRLSKDAGSQEEKEELDPGPEEEEVGRPRPEIKAVQKRQRVESEHSLLRSL